MIRFATLFGLALTTAVSLSSPASAADEGPAYGPELQGFEYPFPVERYRFSSQGQDLEMAYLDVKPSNPNGRAVVMLHGKNFCAATWEGSIKALTAAGYRVIAPDQIGFCKSSKPERYQFTFQQLAGNTRALLASLGIEHAVMMGHSTGGMLAMRYALMYPAAVDQLVLVDPIGLEDWAAKGVPWLSLDGWNEREKRVTADTIRAYERATYYANTWDASYEPWVQMLAGMYRGPGREAVASSSARLYDMIATQPVFYEFERITAPVLLLIGDKDTTAIGKDLAPPDIRSKLGNYPVLGKEAAKRFPHAQLIEFPDLGHAPQIQAPARFHDAVLGWLQHPETGGMVTK
ncbi:MULTISPECIES: alpha/beta fold hydrolase [Bradyrhizobium]|uniref:alpha/beta fold hydrolase n=1 Tax=Bradyrhizobium elkanii TaxID=29448 RepID=UPI0004176BC6|nr:alpha/beta hydrolase [Bradyrhizobium elkanii]